MKMIKALMLGALITGVSSFLSFAETENRINWNMNAEWFMYAPSFAFKKVPGATKYCFRVLDDYHVMREFVTLTPTNSVAPIWKDLPSGFVSVLCLGVNDKGDIVGVAGDRTFWKNASFREGSYPKGKRSYAESVKMGLEYLLERKENRYFLEHRVPDMSYDLNCYPAKMHSAMINAMCTYLQAGLPRKDEAMKLARLSADYLIKIAEAEGRPLAGFPHTYEGTKNVAKLYAGQQMLCYPASVGSAYLSLYTITKDGHYLAEAKRIASTYLRLQGEDGTWYLKLYEKDGKPVTKNRLMPNSVITFLERLYDLTSDDSYRKAADRAFVYIDSGPLKTWNWEGQFEDVAPSEPYINLTKHSACDTAIYLLQRFPNDTHRLAQVQDVLQWVEDQFIAWETPARKDGVGFRNRPGFKARWAHAWQAKYSIWHCPAVMEQYSWYLPIDASAAKLIRTYLAYYQVTGDKLAFAKAKTLGDAAVNNQQDNGLSPTGWFGNYDEYHNWINCHIGTIQALQALCCIVDSDRICNPCVALELPPDSNNSRNSEGDFIRLKDGRILFIYSHYQKGKGYDHDPAVLASRVSSDGGFTWSTNSDVVIANEGKMNVMSVSLLRLQEGPIALFYSVKNSEEDCRPAIRLSMDEGKTWGPRTMCVSDTDKGSLPSHFDNSELHDAA